MIHTKTHSIITIIIMLSLIFTLSGCAGFVAGAAAGASVAHDTRSSSTMLDDATIEIAAKEKLYKDKKLDKKIHISVTSYNHVVLLTGEILSKELLNYSTDIVSKIDKVKRVHNELIVADLSSFSDRSSDTWLTTKIKTKMLGTKGFDSTRIKVVSERGSVYLMGIVTPEVGTQAAEITRHINGVKRVVKLFEYVMPVK